MSMQPRHIVWITLDKRLFSIRYNFGETSEFSALIHDFLINTLEASKLSEDESDYRTDHRPVQIGTYRESSANGATKRYHVSEAIASSFYILAMRLKDDVAEFSKVQEAMGKNLLMQMLKSDVLGEALSK